MKNWALYSIRGPRHPINMEQKNRRVFSLMALGDANVSLYLHPQLLLFFRNSFDVQSVVWNNYMLLIVLLLIETPKYYQTKALTYIIFLGFLNLKKR